MFFGLHFILSKKSLPTLRLQMLSPMYLNRTIILDFTFRSVIYFKLNLSLCHKRKHNVDFSSFPPHMNIQVLAQFVYACMYVCMYLCIYVFMYVFINIFFNTHFLRDRDSTSREGQRVGDEKSKAGSRL